MTSVATQKPIAETGALTVFRNGEDYYVSFRDTGGNIGPFVDLESCLNAAVAWLRDALDAAENAIYDAERE